MFINIKLMLLVKFLISNIVYTILCDNRNESLRISSIRSLDNNCEYKLNDGINCTLSTQEVDIQQIFIELENEIGLDQNHFEYLYWSLPVKNEILPENVFRNFMFDSVFMMTPLHKIHSNAFNSSTYGFNWYDTHEQRIVKLRNYPDTQYDIYEAFCQIKDPKIIHINLDSDYNHEIPDDAFRSNNWTRILWIGFWGNYSIARIGNNFIRNVPSSLDMISFVLNSPPAFNFIENIAKDAFQIEPCSDCSALNIHLIDTQLTEDMLVEGVFDIRGRAVKLNLAQNNLKHLRENIFEPFLLNNKSNSVDVTGNPLECSPESKLIFKWLLNDSEYKDKVIGATCANGTDFWHIDWDSMAFPIEKYCDFTGLTLNCTLTSEEVDIQELFIHLEKELIVEQNLFTLYWSIPIKDGILPEQVFKSIKFSNIYFNSPNLEKLHPNALGSLFFYYLHLGYPTKLRIFSNTGNDLFKALIQSNANIWGFTIGLDINYEHIISDDAFENNQFTDFNFLVFQGQYNISIGKNLIYYFPVSFGTLVFRDVRIKSIAQDAFKVNPCYLCTSPGTEKISIVLEDTQLTDELLVPGVFNTGFDFFTRYVELTLAKNYITLLKEEVFGQFLLNNENNKVLISDNPLECTKRNKPIFDWLLNEPQYKDRVEGATCANGTDFWDIDWESWDFHLDEYCNYQLQNLLNCTLSSEEVDIEEVFASLENEIPIEQQYFSALHWSLPIKDGILPSTVFKNFSFSSVYFDAPNLEKIHVDAFSELKVYHDDTPLLWLVSGSTPSKLRNHPDTQYDLYEAFSKIKSIILLTIDLEWESEHEIPDNAFQNNKWPSLGYIQFVGNYTISRVGDNITYHLPNFLEWFFIEVFEVKEISKNAFYLNDCPGCSALELNINSSRLTDQVLVPGIFDITGRPVSLKLGYNLLTVMREKVFRQFLMNHEQNSIDIAGNPLECTAEAKPIFEWLLNEPKYKDRIIDATCANGTSFWDIDWESYDFPLHEYCFYQLNEVIDCRLSSQEVDIEEVFNSLEKKIPTDQQFFDNLYWSIPLKNETLPANAFKSFQFTNIHLASPNLERIHINSIGTSAKFVYLETPTKLKNVADTQYDLYEACRQMKNLQGISISLDPENQHVIPNDAFINNEWTDFQLITFGPHINILGIGSHLIYDLPDTFYSLTIYDSVIGSIDQDAFKLKPCFDCTELIPLKLTLFKSQLTGEEFKPGLFEMGDRTVYLSLKQNNITILNENIFHPFLLNNENNSIDLSDNPLNCSHETKTIFDWLLSDTQYKSRVQNANCSDGTSIWDFDWDILDTATPTKTTTITNSTETEAIASSTNSSISTTVTGSTSTSSTVTHFPLDQFCSYQLHNLLNCTLSSQEVNIKEVFTELEKEIPDQNYWFEELYWSISIEDRVLPPNAFENFQFKFVYLAAPNLEKIHINSIGSSLQYLSIGEQTNLMNHPGTEYDLFKTLGLITNLRSVVIALDITQEHQIPDNPFEDNQFTNFTELHFQGQYNISNIGNSLIYDLPNTFAIISFRNIKIKNISSKAFYLEQCLNCRNDDKLTIEFNNTQLTDWSIEPGTFNISGRPISLKLGYNHFTLIKEDIFGNFLLNNGQNIIEFTDNPLNCSKDNKQYFDWILKNSEHKNRVNDANCADGSPIWDFDWESPEIPIFSTTEGTTLRPVTSCNSDGEFNGHYNISYWPPVAPGQYSQVNCTNGDGMIKWLCTSDFKFDEKGPIFEECWLDDLLHREVDSIEEVIEILEILNDILVNDSSLNCISSLNKVEAIIEELDNFLQNNTIDSLI